MADQIRLPQLFAMYRLAGLPVKQQPVADPLFTNLPGNRRSPMTVMVDGIVGPAGSIHELRTHAVERHGPFAASEYAGIEIRWVRREDGANSRARGGADEGHFYSLLHNGTVAFAACRIGLCAWDEVPRSLWPPDLAAVCERMTGEALAHHCGERLLKTPHPLAGQRQRDFQFLMTGIPIRPGRPQLRPDMHWKIK